MLHVVTTQDDMSYGGSRVFTWMATVGADQAHLWASEGRVAVDKMTQISCWADDADEEDALQAIAYRSTTVG